MPMSVVRAGDTSLNHKSAHDHVYPPVPATHLSEAPNDLNYDVYATGQGYRQADLVSP